MDRLIQLFSGLNRGPDPQAAIDWKALENAVRMRDEAAVLAGMEACRRLLRSSGKLLLHELMGRLVEVGFGAPCIARCVAMGADVRHVDESGRTPLHAAIYAAGADSAIPSEPHHADRMATLECLLRHGGRALLEARDAEGATPLMYAVEGSNQEMLSWLLRQKVQLDVVDEAGNTALLRAVQKQAVEMLQRLLAGGAEPLRTARPDGMNAMTLAASKRDRATIRLLLRHGVSICAGDAVGRTALHAAAGLPPTVADAVEFVRDLLDSGAPVNTLDDDGRTPLMLAAEAANVEMAKLLLQRGADVTMVAGPGALSRTVLHMAAAAPPRIVGAAGTGPAPEQEDKLRGELVDLLIDAGAKVDALDDVECTPLLLAVEQRCRPAYLALQNAYIARGIAIAPRELMLMAQSAVMPVAPQIAFTRLGKECVALRNELAELRGAGMAWQRERDLLQRQVQTLQANLASSDGQCGQLLQQLAEAQEREAALAARVAGLEGRPAPQLQED